MVQCLSRTMFKGFQNKLEDADWQPKQLKSVPYLAEVRKGEVGTLVVYPPLLLLRRNTSIEHAVLYAHC